jgi:hypothetical protein
MVTVVAIFLGFRIVTYGLFLILLDEIIEFVDFAFHRIARLLEFTFPLLFVVF